MSKELARYEAEGGAEVVLDDATVRRALVKGQGSITDGELKLFVELCKARRMNPFEGDCYLIKYGSQAASTVAGKGYFVKKAAGNPLCEGWRAGVVYLDADGREQRREGSMMLPGEELTGGWAEVYRSGWRVPVAETVSLAEYDTKKSQWAKMPGTMVRKVALCHALREAFPNDYGGLYDRTEMDQAIDGLPQEVEATCEPQAAPQPKPADARHELADACAEFAARMGADAREVMAAQVRRDDYPGRDADPADLDGWFRKVAGELRASGDAVAGQPRVTEAAESAASEEAEYEADDIEF